MLDLLPSQGCPSRTFSIGSSRFASSSCTSGPPSSATSSSLETRLSSLSLDEEGRAESPVLSVCLGKRSASLSLDSPVATPRRSTWAGTCHDNALPRPRSHLLDDGSGSPHLRVKRRYRATMSGQEALHSSSANWCQRLAASVYFVDCGLEDPDVPQRLDELRSRIKKQKTWEQRPSNLSSSGSGGLGAGLALHSSHVPRTASDPEGML